MTHQQKHILICRNAEDSADLQKALEAQGFTCHFLPVFTVVKTTNEAEIRQTFQNLLHFQWMILGSARAITFLFDLFSEFRITLSDYPALRIGIVGKKTGRAFSKYFPEKEIQLIENKLQNLLDQISRKTGVNEISVLNPTSVQSLEKISLSVPDNIHLVRLPIYQTIPNPALSSSEVAAVRSRRWDAVFFGSPTAFDYFVDLIDPGFLKNIPVVVVFGSTTAAHIREKGGVVHVVPQAPGADSVAEAVHLYFSKLKETNATERSELNP